jgi:CheY-like chemotaxis protein
MMKVLIIEDNYDVGMVLGALVRALGHATQLCYCPSEAIKTARHWLPQLVITDIDLPEMDGYQLAPILHEQPGLSNTPIWSLSSHPDNPERRHRAGIEEHVCKPITLSKLQQILAA